MVSLSIIATLLASASALGINCRGSALCADNIGADLVPLITQIKQLIAQGKGQQWYNSGGILL